MHEVKITVPVQQHHHLSVLVMPGLSRGAEAPVPEEDHRSERDPHRQRRTRMLMLSRP